MNQKVTFNCELIEMTKRHFPELTYAEMIIEMNRVQNILLNKMSTKEDPYAEEGEQTEFSAAKLERNQTRAKLKNTFMLDKVLTEEEKKAYIKSLGLDKPFTIVEDDFSGHDK